MAIQYDKEGNQIAFVNGLKVTYTENGIIVGEGLNAVVITGKNIRMYEPAIEVAGNYPDNYPFSTTHKHPKEDEYKNFAGNIDFPYDGIPLDRLPMAIRELKKMIVNTISVDANFAEGVVEGDLVKYNDKTGLYEKATCPDSMADQISSTFFFNGIANLETSKVIIAETVANKNWNLIPGQSYYLDCSNPGKLTTTPNKYFVGKAQGYQTLHLAPLFMACKNIMACVRANMITNGGIVVDENGGIKVDFAKMPKDVRDTHINNYFTDVNSGISQGAKSSISSIAFANSTEAIMNSIPPAALNKLRTIVLNNMSSTDKTDTATQITTTIIQTMTEEEKAALGDKIRKDVMANLTQNVPQATINQFTSQIFNNVPKETLVNWFSTVLSPEGGNAKILEAVTRGLKVPQIIRVDKNFYVDPVNGVDDDALSVGTNNSFRRGTDISCPYRTVQYAADTVSSGYTLVDCNAYINLFAGTYYLTFIDTNTHEVTINNPLVLGSFSGSGTIYIQPLNGAAVKLIGRKMVGKCNMDAIKVNGGRWYLRDITYEMTTFSQISTTYVGSDQFRGISVYDGSLDLRGIHFSVGIAKYNDLNVTIMHVGNKGILRFHGGDTGLPNSTKTSAGIEFPKQWTGSALSSTELAVAGEPTLAIFVVAGGDLEFRNGKTADDANLPLNGKFSKFLVVGSKGMAKWGDSFPYLPIFRKSSNNSGDYCYYLTTGGSLNLPIISLASLPGTNTHMESSTYCFAILKSS